MNAEGHRTLQLQFANGNSSGGTDLTAKYLWKLIEEVPGLRQTWEDEVLRRDDAYRAARQAREEARRAAERAERERRRRERERERRRAERRGIFTPWHISRSARSIRKRREHGA